MALLPRALNPLTYLRRRAFRGGVASSNQVIRMISIMLVGRPQLLRQTAYRQGLFGSNRMWRVVAISFLAGDAWKAIMVRQPENLGTERVVEGQGVTVLALHRPTRRERRRAARSS